MNRPPRVLHCTSEPIAFVGRRGEIDLLDRALAGDDTSVVAFIGPGGQGKTAIVQHWLRQARLEVEGLFFWSFYRGKDVELCLRHWLAYAESAGRSSSTVPRSSSTRTGPGAAGSCNRIWAGC